MRHLMIIFAFQALAVCPTLCAQLDDAAEATAVKSVESTPPLQVELLEVEYATNRSAQNRAALLDIYEKMINRSCFGESAPPLSVDHAPKNEKCLKFIEKTLAIDSGNLTAICTRDGTTSEGCSSAHKASMQGAKDDPLTKLEALLNDQLSTEHKNIPQVKPAIDPTRKKIKELTDELAQATIVYQANMNPDNLSALLRIYDKLLPVVCAPKRRGKGSESAFNAVTEQRSSECVFYAKQATQIDPANILAKCYLEGPESDSCKRYAAFKAKTKSKRIKAPQKDNKGFVSF